MADGRAIAERGTPQAGSAAGSGIGGPQPQVAMA
jgi:hypothetical protein